MPAPKCTDDVFIRMVEANGIAGTARELGVSTRGVQARRVRLSKTHGRLIETPTTQGNVPRVKSDIPGRLTDDVKNGVVLIGSDAHYWPDVISTAHRGFVQFCKELKPQIIIKNGDELDGASISRHPPIGWEKNPSLIQEIETVQERLHEIMMAAPKARRYWNLGNHDARFSTRLATTAPEYANVHGTSLKDHFVHWRPCWSVWINDSVVVKHRFRGGIHAPHNNTLWAGKTIITGHLHSQKVMPISDYGGTRWGVDAGCIAEPYGPQFEYLEDNPRNWRSGFCVLTFVDGVLLQPQLARVIEEGKIDYCGRIIEV